MARQVEQKTRKDDLGIKITMIICLKILFLIAFWYAVLQYQAVHVEAPAMADRLLSHQTN